MLIELLDNTPIQLKFAESLIILRGKIEREKTNERT